MNPILPSETDLLQTERAITALKKGAYLLKYGRRGKPKFCPFHLSNDEAVLIWVSGKEEKHLRLSHVSRIISGQRTPIFQRYPRPEKEYQSFSLIYSNRSLDLICKDKDEAEVWFSGLKALISRSHHRKWRTDSRSDGLLSDTSSPRIYSHRSSPLGSPLGSNDGYQKDGDQLHFHGSCESPMANGFEKGFSDVPFHAVPQRGVFPSDSNSGSLHSLSSGCSDNVPCLAKTAPSDGFRVSLSSAISSSSQGSGNDDSDAMGDVYIWGEGTGDAMLGGVHTVGNLSPKVDSLLPRALESAVVLDVHNIACGGHHAALVTKQGEIFSWGQESGGRLGHGVNSDVSQPKLIDSLSNKNVELVACGEFHTCAVTISGNLFTWGDGTYNFGLLGHGNDVSHWVPKRVAGPLEGIHVSSISCGPWHTAVVTSAGQLFTFGDGTFGVLGHGDRMSASLPREVESLKGLRTVRAACGVWHTAAVVEVMAGNSNSITSSGKLFTWGDGDKGRLGHGDKETKLIPTCVAALVEPNFCDVACGHSMTVSLTTSGHVFTMGSNVYGQLGNPHANGLLPIRVEGKLSRCFVEEIACGSFHVAVLTSKAEVYTWGKGSNGRLGHGDTDDRNSPSFVEALKDQQVKTIACGTNFTAAICLHKWISSVDHTMCSGCHQPFNFKRKRHNCYNCGLVFCHSCSSKKSLKASMAPHSNRPYRVCDNCHTKLAKSIEMDTSNQSSLSRRGSVNHPPDEFVDKEDKMNIGVQSQHSRYSSIESLNQAEIQSKRNKRLEFKSSHVYPISVGSLHYGAQEIYQENPNPVIGSSKIPFPASIPESRTVSRTTSPFSRGPTPTRPTTPHSIQDGLSSPRNAVDDSNWVNEDLRREIVKLRAQVESVTRKSQLQEKELEEKNKQLSEALTIAGEESAKCKAAKEVIKSLTAQLKDMAERLPVGVIQNIKSSAFSSVDFNCISSDNSSNFPVTERARDTIPTRIQETDRSSSLSLSNGSKLGHSGAMPKNGTQVENGETGVDAEWVEQDEPGVYITLTSLPGSIKDLKRVRFSRKRFTQKQAEQWWAENRNRVYEKYNVHMIDKCSTGVGSDDFAH